MAAQSVVENIEEATSAWSFPMPDAEEVGWADRALSRLVSTVIRRYNEAPERALESIANDVTYAGVGGPIIRRGAALSALAGGGVGAIATSGAMFAATSQAPGAIITAAAATLSAAADATLQLVVHTYMACRLAGLIGLRFDPDDPADVWALFLLVRRAKQAPAAVEYPGAELARIARLDPVKYMQGIGARLFGESLARAAVPFVGIVTASATNYQIARKLGKTILRYVRYRAAFDRVLADERLQSVRDQLFEGLWFVFEADGRLKPEETALLFTLLHNTNVESSTRIDERITDPIGWYMQLDQISPEARAPLYRALEIGAVVDQVLSVRERKLLEHAAERLGIRYDHQRLENMMREIGERGLLSENFPISDVYPTNQVVPRAA
jgi:hypothetical protein